MKILLLAAEHGYAFIVQAEDLAKGLTKIGIGNKILKITNSSLPKKEIKKFSPDLILSIGSWHSYQSLVGQPKSLGYRVVPWLVSDDKKSDRVTKYIKNLNQLQLILVPSHHCKKTFIKDGVKEEIIKVLPEAVDPNFWKPISKNEVSHFSNLLSITSSQVDLPIRFDFVKLKKKGIPIIFTMGGIATTKGVQEVISALNKVSLNTKKRQWVYIIKTWPSTDSFEYSIREFKLARKLKVQGIHYLSGQFSDTFVRGIMNICDIYASPSRLEGFGLPLVEAQLCEKPVIGLENTATEETIIDGKTGFVAKSEIINEKIRADTDSLAKILDKLLSDKSLRSEMGKNGRIHAIQSFGPRVIAEKLLEIVK